MYLHKTAHAHAHVPQKFFLADLVLGRYSNLSLKLLKFLRASFGTCLYKTVRARARMHVGHVVNNVEETHTVGRDDFQLFLKFNKQK